METLQVENRNGYNIIRLDRGKANAMNLQMIEELIAEIEREKSDSSVKGTIITGKENFFSAGLDLPEIMTYDQEKTKYFWKRFLDMMGVLVDFPKPLISSITGHSPAGGCIIAICCDYRIMAGGNYKIGLNEIPVGIIVPKQVYELYSFWLGKHRAYQFLMEGRLMSPQQASDTGLVDIIMPAEQVLDAAERKMRQYLSFDQATWSKSKLSLRREIIEHTVHYDQTLPDKMIEHWYLPKTQQILYGFLEMLKKK
ncbi:MAG: enoyl-CoA hydratase/isomerase family protein [Chitinophagales bacterium]|nr:enoyl-CoA hydratase/isomerase family protein [Chitinophagales bacterium]